MGEGRPVLGRGSRSRTLESATHRLGAERDATESKIPRVGVPPRDSRRHDDRVVYLIRAYLTPPVNYWRRFFPEPMQGAGRSATRAFPGKRSRATRADPRDYCFPLKYLHDRF